LNLYDDTFFDLINQAPDVDLRQPDPDGTPFIFQPDFEGREENPLYVLSTEKRNRNRARTQGAMEARYTPRSWLTVDGNVSYDRSDRSTDFFLDQGVKTEGFGNGGPGEISRFNGITDALNASLSANLLKRVGSFTLRSTLRGLMEQLEQRHGSLRELHERDDPDQLVLRERCCGLSRKAHCGWSRSYGRQFTVRSGRAGELVLPRLGSVPHFRRDLVPTQERLQRVQAPRVAGNGRWPSRL
jgi:hypothetical protein